MQIVIEISEKQFQDIKQLSDYGYNSMFSGLVEAIANGTSLPEHHGRLIDADAYIEENKVSRWLGPDVIDEYLGEISVDTFNEDTPTIIPATKPPRWIERRGQLGIHDWMCSVCKCQCEDTVKICPNCGVDTDGRYEMEEDDGGYWFQQREKTGHNERG